MRAPCVATFLVAAAVAGLPQAAQAGKVARPSKHEAKADSPAAAAAATDGEIETVDLGTPAGGTEGAGDAGGGVHANADALMGDDYPQMDRVFDHHTAKVTRPRTVATLIGHRNYEGILRDPWRDLIGFDGGSLKVLLGVRYGVMGIFDVGVARMNRTFERYTTWELDTKVQVFRQERVGIDLAVRAGMDIFESPSSTSAGFLGQLLLSRTLSDRALVGGGVLFSSLSSGQYKRDSDPSSSAALMVEAELRVIDTLSLAVEIAYNIAGFGESWPVVTYGPKFVTNRHTFSIVVSNSQYVTADSLVANTYRSNWRDWLLGFHITREI